MFVNNCYSPTIIFQHYTHLISSTARGRFVKQKLVGGFVEHPSLTQAGQQSVTQFITMFVINQVTPRASAKHELSFNKPASGLAAALGVTILYQPLLCIRSHFKSDLDSSTNLSRVHSGTIVVPRYDHPGFNVIILFCSYVRIFVISQSVCTLYAFKPSLIFAGKVIAYPSEAPFSCSTLRSYPQTLDQAGKLTRDKHSSLLRKSVNYGTKSFITLGQVCELTQASTFNLFYVFRPPIILDISFASLKYHLHVRFGRPFTFPGFEIVSDCEISPQCDFGGKPWRVKNLQNMTAKSDV